MKSGHETTVQKQIAVKKRLAALSLTDDDPLATSMALSILYYSAVFNDAKHRDSTYYEAPAFLRQLNRVARFFTCWNQS